MANSVVPPAPWQKIVVLFGLLLLMGGFAFVAAPHLPPARDFDQTFYPASRYTLAGENPYTAVYTETDQGAAPDFFSPPWLLLILLPFGLFSLAMARALWLLFLVGVTLLGIGLMGAWGFRGLRPFALIALPWVLISLLFGQVTPLVFLGAILCLVELAKETHSRQSILKLTIGFLLIGVKPQLGLFIAVPMVLWLLWQRDKRLWPLAVIGIMILTMTLLITPPALLLNANHVQNIAPQWQSTLERELLLWGWPLWIAQGVRLVVVAVMGYWAWQKRTLTPVWWSAWLTAVLIITPYSRAYDGVLLLPLLGQMIGLRRWWQTAVFLLTLTLYLQLPIGELGSVITPLTAWLLFIPWRSLIPSSSSKLLATK